MKIAYIMRGISGSGKSTRAKELAGNIGVIHSTDDYFYVDGKYQFDPSQLTKYHEQNFAAFCGSLKNGAPIVICDNTNAKWRHYEWYIRAAKEAGYVVQIILMPHIDPEVAAERTIHNTPLHAIQRMLAEWEPY